MNIKIDENLPPEVRAIFVERGHSADTVIDEQLGGRNDDDVWAAARAAGRFFVTQDMDFSDIRKFQPGSHPGLLLVRLHFPSRKRLIERIVGIARTEPLDLWARCFVVATDHKIRVHRPSSG